ncbi:MAG TPA: hypothetical protein VFA85_02490 [Terriglobales bacterium]|nr:hypothetical protein [Terriglobales bacterium]
MAQLTYTNESVAVRPPATDWRAIWAGVFTFIAIWSVFGFLGMAIFASSANPNAAQPIMGMSVGMGIWAIVLTIIAMYVAGLETGRLAAVTTRHDGLIHGMIMFGLSVASVIVLTVLAGSIFGPQTSAAGTHSSYTLTLTADLGWMIFLCLFLGWLAAMGGASTGAGRRSSQKAQVQEIRSAA